MKCVLWAAKVMLAVGAFGPVYVAYATSKYGASAGVAAVGVQAFAVLAGVALGCVCLRHGRGG